MYKKTFAHFDSYEYSPVRHDTKLNFPSPHSICNFNFHTIRITSQLRLSNHAFLQAVQHPRAQLLWPPRCCAYHPNHLPMSNPQHADDHIQTAALASPATVPLVHPLNGRSKVPCAPSASLDLPLTRPRSTPLSTASPFPETKNPPPRSRISKKESPTSKAALLLSHQLLLQRSHRTLQRCKRPFWPHPNDFAS